MPSGLIASELSTLEPATHLVLHVHGLLNTIPSSNAVLLRDLLNFLASQPLPGVIAPLEVFAAHRGVLPPPLSSPTAPLESVFLHLSPFTDPSSEWERARHPPASPMSPEATHVWVERSKPLLRGPLLRVLHASGLFEIAEVGTEPALRNSMRTVSIPPLELNRMIYSAARATDRATVTTLSHRSPESDTKTAPSTSSPSTSSTSSASASTLASSTEATDAAEVDGAAGEDARVREGADEGGAPRGPAVLVTLQTTPGSVPASAPTAHLALSASSAMTSAALASESLGMARARVFFLRRPDLRRHYQGVEWSTTEDSVAVPVVSKESLRSTLAPHACGFLNRGVGGRVVFGVKEDGTFLGTSLNDRQRRQLEEEVVRILRRTLVPPAAFHLWSLIWVGLSEDDRSLLTPTAAMASLDATGESVAAAVPVGPSNNLVTSGATAPFALVVRLEPLAATDEVGYLAQGHFFLRERANTVLCDSADRIVPFFRGHLILARNEVARLRAGLSGAQGTAQGTDPASAMGALPAGLSAGTPGGAGFGVAGGTDPRASGAQGPFGAPHSLLGGGGFSSARGDFHTHAHPSMGPAVSAGLPLLGPGGGVGGVGGASGAGGMSVSVSGGFPGAHGSFALPLSGSHGATVHLLPPGFHPGSGASASGGVGGGGRPYGMGMPGGASGLSDAAGHAVVFAAGGGGGGPGSLGVGMAGAPMYVGGSMGTPASGARSFTSPASQASSTASSSPRSTPTSSLPPNASPFIPGSGVPHRDALAHGGGTPAGSSGSWSSTPTDDATRLRFLGSGGPGSFSIGLSPATRGFTPGTSEAESSRASVTSRSSDSTAAARIPTPALSFPSSAAMTDTLRPWWDGEFSGSGAALGSAASTMTTSTVMTTNAGSNASNSNSGAGAGRSAASTSTGAGAGAVDGLRSSRFGPSSPEQGAEAFGPSLSSPAAAPVMASLSAIGLGAAMEAGGWATPGIASMGAPASRSEPAVEMGGLGHEALLGGSTGGPSFDAGGLWAAMPAGWGSDPAVSRGEPATGFGSLAWGSLPDSSR